MVPPFRRRGCFFVPDCGKLIEPTTEGVGLMITIEQVLVLLFAQVLFAYYYIALRVSGLPLIVRVW